MWQKSTCGSFRGGKETTAETTTEFIRDLPRSCLQPILWKSCNSFRLACSINSAVSGCRDQDSEARIWRRWPSEIDKDFEELKNSGFNGLDGNFGHYMYSCFSFLSSFLSFFLSFLFLLNF